MVNDFVIKHKTGLRIVTLFIGGPIIIGLIIHALEVNSYLKFYDINQDISNGATLIVEIGIGVIIALSILIYSKDQQDKVTEILAEQDKQYKEIQQDVAEKLIRKLEFVQRNLEQSLKLDKKWKETKNVNFRNSLASNYDLCYNQANLELNLIDLMKIFNVDIARKYWKFLVKLGIKSDMFFFSRDNTFFPADNQKEKSEKEYLRFVDYINECLKICNELTGSLKELLPKK